jgi:hypothetical protein
MFMAVTVPTAVGVPPLLLPPDPPVSILIVTSPVPASTPVEDITIPFPAMIFLITAWLGVVVFRAYLITEPPRISVVPLTYSGIRKVY